MRLKSFRAPTIAEAIAHVRREMGEDAIIVSTQVGDDGVSARVTAAVEDPSDDAMFASWESELSAAAPPVRPADAGSGSQIRTALERHGLPLPLIERIVGAAQAWRAERIEVALGSALDATIGFLPPALGSGNGTKVRPIMLVGPPGAGKTVASAKLIVQAHRSGEPVRAISTDRKRAGGVEQLEAFTRILGVGLSAVETPLAVADAVRRANGARIVIDTAGINPFSDADLGRLAALRDASDAEPVVVLPAGLDALEAADIATRLATLGGQRLVGTRLDAARRFGCLLAAAETSGLCLCNVSISESVADALAPINPMSFARLLLPGEMLSPAP